MWMGPGYLFVVAASVGFVGTIVGGFARLFGWRWSRVALIVAAVGTLVGYRGYDTYVDTYLMAGAEAVWIFLMGWLIATPEPEATETTRKRPKKTSAAIALAVIIVFSFVGWIVFGRQDNLSFVADVNLDIEANGRKVESAEEMKIAVGSVSTVRVDGYIVDFLIQSATDEEVDVVLRVFEDKDGARGKKLASCASFQAPIAEVFGFAVSCENLVLGLSGQFDRVEKK